MTEDQRPYPTPEESKPRYTWEFLHDGTLGTIAVLAVCFCATNIWGEYGNSYCTGFEIQEINTSAESVLVKHGWPLTWLVRNDWNRQASVWPFDGKPLRHFFPRTLGLNIGVGVLLTISAAFTVERWWLRKRTHFQFGLRSLLLLTCFICIVLGLASNRILPWQALLQVPLYLCLPCVVYMTITIFRIAVRGY